jgi:hypothetical protein
MRDYPTLHSDTDWSKGTWETMQHYTQKQIEVYSFLLKTVHLLQSLCYVYCCIVSHVTLLPYVSGCNVRYSLMFRHLHSETDWGKGTDCSKKEYGCKWTWDYPTSHSDTDWSKRTWETIQHMFLYFNLCLSVMLDSLSSSFTSIFFLTTSYSFTSICVWV